MRTDNVSIADNGDNKEIANVEEKKSTRVEDTTKIPEPMIDAISSVDDSSDDIEAELEGLKAEVRGLFSDLTTDKTHHHELFRKGVVDEVESIACCVKHGYVTKDIDSFQGLTLFTIKDGMDTFEINICSETSLQIPSCHKEDLVYAIVHSIRGNCVARIVCSETFYHLFDVISDTNEKLGLMRKYLELSPSQQNNIQQQLRGKKYGLNYDEDAVRFKELDELRLKYKICRETYTQQQQRDIDNLFAECRGIGKPGKSLLKLKYILNITPTSSIKQVPSRKSILEVLNRRLYKLDKVKTEIVEAIVASKYSQNHGLRLLLVGGPGTGKTTIIRAIAEAYGLPCDIVHLNGASSALEIKGTDSTYDGSDAGKLVKSFFQLGTTEAVIGLDEIDKMASGGKDGNPADALLDTLSDEHICYDAFLETGIDTHNTIYIATANSTQNIPEFLLNRFKVIYVDDYEEEDKVVIAREYIIPQLLDSYNLTVADIEFPDTTLLYVIKQFCCDNGARMLKENVHSIIRRIINIWDETGMRNKVVVDNALVDARLEPVVNANTAQMRYHRNKTRFSKCVQADIKKSFVLLQDAHMDSHKRETITRKLEYLTSIIPEDGGFGEFDKVSFIHSVNSTHFGLSIIKKTIAKAFYAKALKKECLSSERLLLVGGPGIGKSSICRSIANGLGIPYIKISLNGVTDVHMLKGFEPTYIGSDAGIIVKELAKAGTTKVLIQLDEVDKLGVYNGIKASNALLDLLDNSSEFTDIFLGVPLDLSNVLFVATANDLSNIEPWLLDRFSIIQLDGYAFTDKEKILEQYLIPKLESEYAETGIKISISKEAKRILLKDYCTSFGVRDLEKAINNIVNDMLYDNEDPHSLQINTSDVIKSLGPKPIPRGNLLKKNVPGFSKALAVSGNNSGMSFSIESAILPSENSTCITGLPKESAVDSVKLAKTYIKTRYLSGDEDFGIHLHFGEGAVVKDGPSAGVAIMVSMLSAVFNIPVSGNVAFTGEIDLFGNVFAIGGTIAKIQAAEDSGCEKVFIPFDNYCQLSYEDINKFDIEIVPIQHVSEVIDVVLPALKEMKKKH